MPETPSAPQEMDFRFAAGRRKRKVRRSSPKTSTGKIQKFTLRAMAKTARTD